MWNIAKQIQAAAATLHISAAQLTAEQTQLIRGQILTKYTSHQERPHLWECLTDAVSIQNGEAWKWIGTYQRGHPSILFFNPDDELAMFEFLHNHDITSTLSECTGFEFYITNKETNFLLASIITIS